MGRLTDAAASRPASPGCPPVDPAARNVEAQRGDPGSMLSFVRALIELRRTLGDGFELVDAAEGVVAYRRGDHVVAVNTTPETLPGAAAREAAPRDRARGVARAAR